MGIVALLELRPRQPATGAPVIRRFCWNARVRARFLGEQWEPTLLSLPTFETSLGFDGQGFGQGAIPQVGQAEIAVERDDPMLALAWPGAEAFLRIAPWPETGLADPADADFGPAMPLRVENARVAGDTLRLTLIDAGRDLRRTALARRFGTSGTAQLDGADTVDRHGQPIPNGWGVLRSVPGILVDRAHNIWLFLDRASTSVQGFYDGGAAFTLGQSRASLAALQSNTPAAGAVDYALAAGGLTLARPWTTPQYPFTADLTAGDTRPAEIAAAIVGSRTSLGFVAGRVAAFNAVQSGPAGLYIDDERDVAGALDAIFAGLGSWWKLTAGGQIDLGQYAFAAPAVTFPALSVIEIEREAVHMPTRRRGVGFARNNRVHSEGEIALILLTRRRFVYRRSVSQPATPTGNGLPSGWADLPPSGSDPLWESSAEQDGAGLTFGSWATPVRKEGVDGPPGDDGEDGADGLTGIGAALFEIGCAANGTPRSGQLPQTRALRLFQGASEVTASASWSISGVTGGTITVVAATGVVTISAISADEATATVTATLGPLQFAFPVFARKVRDGAAGVSGPFPFNAPASTTFAQAGISQVFAQGEGRSVSVSASANFNDDALVTVEAYLQYRQNGGSWVTIGSTVQASNVFDAELQVWFPGTIAVTATVPPPASGVATEVRVMARRVFGVPNTWFQNSGWYDA